MTKRLPLITSFIAVALWAPLAVSVTAVSTTVVISEFRTRGPLGGNDEFVELHNVSAAPVDISGWKLKGSNNAGGGTTTPRATVPAATILNPGCFYLITNAAANGYSGSVPGNRTYTVGITDDGGLAITRSDDTVVDAVGMSAGSAFKEGTPLAAFGSTNGNRSYERNPGGVAGHQDTDDNGADFEMIAPANPQNASSACLDGADFSIDGAAAPNPVVQFDPLLVTAAVAPATNPASTGIVVTADLAVLGGIDNQPLVDDGTNGDAAAGDSIYSFSLASVTAAAGSYGVAFDAGDAESRAATDTISVVVLPPPIIYLPHDIQGSGLTSPRVGETVTVEGVVTGRRSSGFFIQTAPGSEDPDPLTSEGLFVFGPADAPVDLAAGTLVRVTGTVAEFSGDGAGLTHTELANSPHVVVLGPAALPAPTPLTAADLSPGGGVHQLEQFEGMLVSITSLTSVSPTDGFFASATGGEASGIATSSGVFFAVLTGTARPVREAGILEPFAPAFANACASGPPCAIPLFDSNPERLRVDSDALGGSVIDVTSGVDITGVTAIIDSGFLTWGLLPVPWAAAPAVGASAAATAVSVPGATQFTVASFNLQRFFDTVNDDGVSDVALTPANYAARLQKASLVVRTALHLPDVLAVQEVENIGVLQDLAEAIGADAGMPGEYTAHLAEGNDPGGIDVGFLVRSRVLVASVVQEGKTTTFVDPDDNSVDILHDRPPLVLRATVTGPAGTLGTPVIVVANHLRSLGGVESPSSARVRVKRQQQAEFLAGLLDALQDEAPVMSVGDYNAFDVNDGFVDVLGTVKGVPAPADQVVVSSPALVAPPFVNAAPGVHSYVFDGSAQTLDHVLLSQGALDLFAGLQHARLNADFPEVYRNDASRVERLSDHDPAVAYFNLPLAGAMTGGGSITSGTTEVSFEFRVQEGPEQERGRLQVRVREGGRGRPAILRSTAITSVLFFESVTFAGEAAWNGAAGYTFEVEASDRGEPGRDDTFSITVRDPGGAVVLSAAGTLRAGNNQSHRAPRR